MVTKFITVPPFTGGYNRTLSETSSHRLSIPEFIDVANQRNYANLPFYVNEGYLEVTKNGIKYQDDLLYCFDSALPDEVFLRIKASPIQLLVHLDALDSSIFGTVDGQEVECRSWTDYVLAQSRGEIKPEKTYQMKTDNLGRITIPKGIKDALGLEGTVSVLLIGVGNHFTLTKRKEMKFTSYRS